MNIRRTLRRLNHWILGLAAAAALAAPVAAQQATPTLDRPLRVFLDCNFHCDRDYFIEQMPWVDFVRDRKDADVHVLGTRESTGAGGDAYTLEFIGRGAFDGMETSLTTTTSADATDSAERDALVNATSLGLAPYAAGTPAASGLSVAWEAPEGGMTEGPRDDPWNAWVFELGMDGSLDGESSQRSKWLSAGANASRVTEDWKLGFSSHTTLNHDEFEIDDSTKVVSRRERYGANALMVKSLSPHWSAGGALNWSRDNYANIATRVKVNPAIEYDVFPYSESTRRRLAVLYLIGPSFFDYEDQTIYEETRETVLQQMLVVEYEVTQPWGSASARALGSHYIAKFGDGLEWKDPKYYLSLNGGMEVRLLRGLSADLSGSVGLIRDQITLRAGDLSEEEILTQQRELATDYRYRLYFGLSYQFGSIYSAVVNPRFEFLD